MSDITIQSGIRSLISPPTLESAPGVSQTDKSFGDFLQEQMNTVNDLQKEANLAAEELVTDGDQSIHDTMIALEKADLSFRLLMQIRNKAIEAYREIWRMPV